jgi:hypothetical protein
MINLILILALSAVGASQKMTWEAPTTNEDGTALTDLAGYEIAISDSGVNLNDSDIALARIPIQDKTAVEWVGNQLSAGLPSGQYAWWIRAVDEAGNKSEYAGPVILTLKNSRPNKPKNFNVR